MKQAKAFTFVEVLIILVILGVLAALTIPALVSKANEHAMKQAWKNNFSILNNAFTLALQEFGSESIVDGHYYSAPSLEFINLVLSNLNVIDTCETINNHTTSQCNREPLKYNWASSETNKYKALDGSTCNNYDYGEKSALLSNGAAISFGGLWSGTTILVDVNNYTKGPNIIGKDVFAINIIKDGNTYKFLPYGAPGTAFMDDSMSGTKGCSAEFGGDSNMLGKTAGIGCSYKYLYEI